MTEDIKELVTRLRDQKFQYSGPQPDVMNEVADAIEELVGEVASAREKEMRAQHERDRLKAALVQLKMHIGPGYEYAGARAIFAAALRAAGEGQ